MNHTEKKLVGNFIELIKDYVLYKDTGKNDGNNLFCKISNIANCLMIDAVYIEDMAISSDKDFLDITNITSTTIQTNLGFFDKSLQYLARVDYNKENLPFEVAKKIDGNNKYIIEFNNLTTIFHDILKKDFKDNQVCIQNIYSIDKEGVVELNISFLNSKHIIDSTLAFNTYIIYAVKAFELAILECAKVNNKIDINNVTAKNVCDAVDHYNPMWAYKSANYNTRTDKSKWLEKDEKSVINSKYYNDITEYIDLTFINTSIEKHFSLRELTTQNYFDFDKSIDQSDMFNHVKEDLSIAFENDNTDVVIPKNVESAIDNIIKAGWGISVFFSTFPVECVGADDGDAFVKIGNIIINDEDGSIIDIDEELSNPDSEMEDDLLEIKGDYDTIMNWIYLMCESKGISKDMVDENRKAIINTFKNSVEGLSSIVEEKISAGEDDSMNTISINSDVYNKDESSDNENSKSQEDKKLNNVIVKNSNLDSKGSSNIDFNPVTYCDELANRIVDKYMKFMIVQSDMIDDDIVDIINVIKDVMSKSKCEFYSIDKNRKFYLSNITGSNAILVNIVIRKKLVESFVIGYCPDDDKIMFHRVTDTVLTLSPNNRKYYQNLCKYNLDSNMSFSVFSRGGTLDVDLKELYEYIVKPFIPSEEKIEACFSYDSRIHDITKYILSILQAAFTIQHLANNINNDDILGGLNNTIEELKDDSTHSILNGLEKVYDKIEIFDNNEQARSKVIDDLICIMDSYINNNSSVLIPESKDDYVKNYSLDQEPVTVILPNRDVLVKSADNKVLNIKNAVSDFHDFVSSYIYYHAAIFSISYTNKWLETDVLVSCIAKELSDARPTNEIASDILKVSKYLKAIDLKSSSKKRKSNKK